MEKESSSPIIEKNFSGVIKTITANNSLNITANKLKTAQLFIAVNAAIILTVLFLSQWDIRIAFLALLIGSFVPFVMLFLSKFLAKISHNIQEIQPGKFRNKNEEQLYKLIKELSAKAGIERMPEVGIYDSPELNAFATGWNKNNSLIAFSSGLINTMNEDAIAAVAAHEVAHAANGDMLSMTLIQGGVNAVVSLINIALYFVLNDKEDREKGRIFTTLVRWVIVNIFMFLGNLIVLWFSRFREFGADKLASELVSKEAMIGALDFLKGNEDIEIPAEMSEEQAAYASFKISSKSAFIDILSTHPSLERRIERLNNIQ